MDFLIKALLAWLDQDEQQTCVIYGADGSFVGFVGSIGTLGIPDVFIPEATNQLSTPWDGWICLPINLNGEYCGCVVSHDKGRNTDAVLTVAEIIKCACGL